jgi:2-haloacid dehalogenase
MMAIFIGAFSGRMAAVLMILALKRAPSDPASARLDPFRSGRPQLGIGRDHASATMTAAPHAVEALLFDVFGTVVDWRGSCSAELEAFGRSRGISADWVAFTDQWRGLYQPSMEAVRSGRRPWTILDVLHRESLDTLLAKFGLEDITPGDREHLTRIWHRLKPWPDVVAGLTALKTRYIIGTLSNGNVGLLTRLAKTAGLPWDVVLGAETAQAYKPLPQAYRRAAELLNLAPERVMLVAAHNGDLAAAQACGFATAFVPRPTEYGPHQTGDLGPTGDWTLVASDFLDLARRMGAA